tara:strand:+ start:1741 stop:2007 length:267 start_codon:yes stop_codon:yes gene_type:complete
MSEKKSIKAFQGKFVKKNGDQRIMKFVKVSDLPKAFVDSKIKDSTKPRKLQEKCEVVWELETGFRVFNWGTVIGEVQEFFVGKNELLS